MSSLSGKVQTVLGLVEPSKLGRTLTHEHLTMTFDCSFCPPSPCHEAISKEPIMMKNLFWIQNNPYSHKENLQLNQETEAIKEELLYFKAKGGGAVVENTTTGISRDVQTLKRLAEQTGVHIIAGAGFYVDATHSAETRAMSVEQLTDVLINEILHGADGTSIKCGVIGEIGCSWPLTESERKVLQATAHAQAQLGCPVTIHPGRNSSAPFQIIRVLQEAGADMSKTVMGHLDRSILDKKELMEFAQLGCYLEYDLFGTEFLNYQFNPDIDMPDDNKRIRRVRFLVEEGYEDRILMAHDIHTKHRLMKYGGHGYSHILTNIVPKMLLRGITQHALDKILIENPKQWLTFK
ncbi:N-acetyltaurine hydrolase [Ictidomys tridecemlineatus]|uniref:N-acetyltaurine hydrolase n=1 Tax=Ictidomys tridecemlineatus TaxID=43179 RepID=I3NGZ6_ICTTR|nr:phosphotriesterase-related protein [Ictidomys tridecemlineatus]XP_021582346.1 phosphotriesterase-related protein [Ictidomys tridecemlineatus]KAG3257552.1 phosphotriesterase related, transcript variant X1 [Ictidomys tridecemlineatus]KAG3257553.1 phosphotriesterase related, transcript variant X2 [Ictidomys tridecemlineatus]